MTPVIFNQRIVETTTHSITLAWEGSADADTSVYWGTSPYALVHSVRARRGAYEAVIEGLRPATTVSFRIVSRSAAGGVFETPVYQARTLDARGRAVTEPP